MAPPLHVLTAARRICERSGWRVSNLELQKILYLAHMVHMGVTGHRLVNESFEAWDYGPVSPRLYQQVKAFGADPIQDVFHGAPSLPPGQQAAAIDSACDALLRKTPGQLVAMTHRKDGAWAKNYKPGVRHVVIPDEDILQEYRQRVHGR